MITFITIAVSIWFSHDCEATIDPTNHTTIHIDDLQFNVTHHYWRTRFLLDNHAIVSFWVNPYELPESMLLYEKNRWQHITKSETMYNFIVKTTKRVFDDWGIGYRRVMFADYYRQIAQESDYLNKKPLYPIHERSIFNSGYPLLIHFRYKPYPQSSFGEFVSDRAAVWRVWDNHDDYKKSSYVGTDDDLLYRMRHNIGHSMGLGHTTSMRCVMHPINVRHLASLCSAELNAMHALLTTPRIVDDGY